MDSINEIWENVLVIMQNSGISRIAYDVWISCLEPLGIEDGEMVLCVNTEFQRKTISDIYADRLIDALQEVLGIPLGLRIVTRGGAPVQEEEKALPIEGNGYPASAGEDDYTFDNFVVGPSNRYAHAASVAITKGPSVGYNPLFIYGGSGLGKTHLLCAICREIRRCNPRAHILYTKGETMTNELVDAIKNKTTNEFHNKYRQVDVLLVDDIQFISGKEQTQVEFFHTFETLYTAGKQIVLTSDRPPKEIAELSDRLRGRFEMGLMADIQPPDYETRVAIIRRKAQALELPLEDEVTEYIANQLKSNVRQLEGVVKRMRAQYMLNNEQPTLIAAQNAIRDIRNDNQPVPITVERILSEVARTMNVQPEDIRSNKQSSAISKARHVAAYAVHEITGLTLQSIGQELGGRDHTTILYGVNKVRDKMNQDATFKNMVNDIIKNISDK